MQPLSIGGLSKNSTFYSKKSDARAAFPAFKLPEHSIMLFSFEIHCSIKTTGKMFARVEDREAIKQTQFAKR